MTFFFLFQRNPSDRTPRESGKRAFADDEAQFTSELAGKSFLRSSRESKSSKSCSYQLKEVRLKLTINYFGLF